MPAGQGTAQRLGLGYRVQRRMAVDFHRYPQLAETRQQERFELVRIAHNAPSIARQATINKGARSM
jgi:hypothetical protein